MLFLMNIFYFCATLMAHGVEFPGLKGMEYMMAASYDNRACLDTNQTYSIDIAVHFERPIVKAIHEIAKSHINPMITESAAVSGYVGTIFDKLNVFLIQFKVQLHPLLNGYDMNDYMGTIPFDSSCEIGTPITQRASELLKYHKSISPDYIALNLYVTSCIYLPPATPLQEVLTNLKCGRLMTALWKGTKETQTLIMNAIIAGLTNTNLVFSNQTQETVDEIGRALCKYAQGCVGMDGSEIGQLVQGTNIVKYTDVVDSTGNWSDIDNAEGFAAEGVDLHAH